MRLDRRRKGEAYPWLEWKVRLFVIGAMLALGGMAMALDWLIWAALPVLAAGFLVRFLPGGRGVMSEEQVGSEGDGGEEENAEDDRSWWAS